MPQQTYYCSHCQYITDHKAKYDRHLDTIKHQIAVEGIICCGLQYFDKHKWVNHKKSLKHNSRPKVKNPIESKENEEVPKEPNNSTAQSSS